ILDRGAILGGDGFEFVGGWQQSALENTMDADTARRQRIERLPTPRTGLHHRLGHIRTSSPILTAPRVKVAKFVSSSQSVFEKWFAGSTGDSPDGTDRKSTRLNSSHIP